MPLRPLTVPVVLLALAACGSDAARTPVGPSAPTFAKGSHGDVAAKAKHIHGTLLQAIEVGSPPPISVRHLEGEGTASHLGRFTVVADFTVNLVTLTGSGSVAFTAANGDVLTGTVTGVAVVSGGIAAVTETVTITGGTGRFVGATGTLTVTRHVVLATGVSSGTIDGTIMLPK